jgi:hypothetical protein
MKGRSFSAVVVFTLVALCWLDAPKAQAWRGFGYGGVGWRGVGWRGVGWGWGGWHRPWIGWNRPWIGWNRPWIGWNRPWIGWNRPWIGWYRPWWGWRAGYPIYATGYSPYYYGNYSTYSMPYYGSYNDCQPINGSPGTYQYPVMPRSNGGSFNYNGGPQTLVPIPEAVPVQPLNGQFISVQANKTSIRFPAYGEKSPPAATATATVPTPPIAYPAYGEQHTPPATLVSNSKR